MQWLEADIAKNLKKKVTNFHTIVSLLLTFMQHVWKTVIRDNMAKSLQS